MKKLSILITTLFVTSALLSACGEKEVDRNSANNQEDDANQSIETVEIVTTLFPLEDFANRIGGEHVEVKNMIPIGGDVHTFEPTANEMIEVAEADLFIYNGADFEGFADSIRDVVEPHNVTILTASEGIDLIGYDHGNDHEEDNHGDEENSPGHEDNDHDHEDNHGHENNEHDHGENNPGHENDEHEHNHADEDPHVWLDPIRAIELAENVKNALVHIRPDAEEEFNENFEELKLELEGLDDSFQTMADEITRDIMIVSHAGYGYWEDRYGIHQVAISGLSPTNEPSIKQIEEVINLMERNNINYVMFEQNIPTNIAETVREEVGAEELWLHNLEVLTEGNITNDDDYFSLMEQNIETLRKGLN